MTNLEDGIMRKIVSLRPHHDGVRYVAVTLECGHRTVLRADVGPEKDLVVGQTEVACLKCRKKVF